MESERRRDVEMYLHTLKGYDTTCSARCFHGLALRPKMCLIDLKSLKGRLGRNGATKPVKRDVS